MVLQLYRLAEGWIFDAELQTSWSSWRSIGCKDKRRGKLGEKHLFAVYRACNSLPLTAVGHCRSASVGIV